MPHTLLVIGASSLGRESPRLARELRYYVLGVDNYPRAMFFGLQGHTRWNLQGFPARRCA